MMYTFVFIQGSQGAGKTTTARLLKDKLHSVHIDFDWIRGFHLNKDWSNCSKREEALAIENMVLLLQNYAKHDYKNIIVSGFSEEQAAAVANGLKEFTRCEIILYLTDDEVLKKRVLTETRDSGYRDYETSIAWNKKLREIPPSSNLFKIDSTSQTPEETANQVIALLEK